MIKIKGRPFELSTIENQYSEDSIEKEVLNTMMQSTEVYEYDSIENIQFELKLRKEIVNSAIELNKSGMDFKIFKESKCNDKFWERTDSGGFKLKENVKPNNAIQDIFINGNQYGTECATAMMIVYYKALLNVFGENRFNETFPNIYLMDWDVREPLLREVRTVNPAADVLLGDRKYFSNPEFNEETPEWQGENVIVLDKEKHYGHGIGIKTAEQMIEALNLNRKEDATQSAYLMKSAGRPSFQKLNRAYYKEEIPVTILTWNAFPRPIFQLA